ncbi:HNH endonuclease signature motif containing protein [Falsihalocynthiibacter sp. CO-5D18]|uniref:HNH endonuclease signature motif containing protein n=1 Tax=Falsihalocynthiibacter sp. CO-5D18 TaxID=3240872 RepID=UPI0035101BDF
MNIDALREAVGYDPLIGLLYWRWRDDVPLSTNNRFAGKRAFAYVDVGGYLMGGFRGKRILAHRAAFAIAHGYLPEQVDHINGVTSDNRYLNLRASNYAENHRNQRKASNNTSGVMGVTWHKQCQKWRARIKINNRYIHLGLFANKADAIASRRAAEVRYGFDPLHGHSSESRADRHLNGPHMAM